MLSALTAAGARFRVLANRVLVRLGFREDAFLLFVAILIGLATAAASVAFHELIVGTRELLFAAPGESYLYGKGMWLLVAVPTAGGLAVGLLRRVFRVSGIHGIVDVIESVIRERGFVHPVAAVEKTLTAGLTIGTGGSVGAEAPIVQIGAAIASAFGRLFGIARQHMPLAVGCGSAAGISAIFNAPVGGVLFTLEVILGGEYSLRTFAPMVVASFTANVTTQAISAFIWPDRPFQAIFALPASLIGLQHNVGWSTAPHFLILGVASGLVAVGLTKLMTRTEHGFQRLPVPTTLKPAVGGLAVGLLGVLYVLVFGRMLLGQAKPIPFDVYPMPAFFSDGYGAIQPMLKAGFYDWYSVRYAVGFLAALLVLKAVACSLTVSSGGGGGVIGPALFLGAVLGGLLGVVYRVAGSGVAQPHVMALVGMAAVLSAVVHAPMASIVILLELTQDYKLTLPAMIATIVSVGVARMVSRDSIYTVVLRERGVQIGDSADLRLLRRLTVEQVELAPVITVHADEPVARLLGRIEDQGVGDYVVTDADGRYGGMVTADDLVAAMYAGGGDGGLLVASDLAHGEVRPVRTTDDLASVLDRFATSDVENLPVITERAPGHVIGMVSRANLLRRYREGLGVVR